LPVVDVQGRPWHLCLPICKFFPPRERGFAGYCPGVRISLGKAVLPGSGLGWPQLCGLPAAGRADVLKDFGVGILQSWGWLQILLLKRVV
jgi:hypothetical protein